MLLAVSSRSSGSKLDNETAAAGARPLASACVVVVAEGNNATELAGEGVVELLREPGLALVVGWGCVGGCENMSESKAAASEADIAAAEPEAFTETEAFAAACLPSLSLSFTAVVIPLVFAADTGTAGGGTRGNGGGECASATAAVTEADGD